MIQVFRVTIMHILFFLLQKVLKRFSTIFALLIFLSALLIAADYINSLSPKNSIDTIDFSEEEATSESKIDTVIIKRGDTLSTILKKQNLSDSDITQIIGLATEKSLISKLKIGQKILFEYKIQIIEPSDSDLNEESFILERIIFTKDKLTSIELIRQDDKFVAHDIMIPLKRIITRYNTTIESSVVTSLKKSGMTADSIVRLINAYSHQIDFQRQIKPGDKMTVIAEKFVTENDEFSHHGKILYANLNSQKIDHKIYRFSPNGKEGDGDFFSEEGQSIKSTLLRTPLKVARISSHYGYRKKHPVLGYGKMHKGVDFAASVGTPIYASGNGTVSFIGWKSGYGRLIVIKHDNKLSTAYAHASKFAKGLKKGSRVKQGDIIALVGTSGRTTGPHLHYEVRVDGQQVNPVKFKSKPGIQLAGTQLDSFKQYKKDIIAISKKLEQKLALTNEDINRI
jgi:murein DD-endopeptidase MepM/ murein hydrolase activator NlpD